MREDDVGRFESLIDDIYRAGVDDGSWTACLNVFCVATGAMGCVLCDLSDPVGAIVSESLRETNLAYRQGWGRRDSFMAAVLSQSPKPGVLADDAFDDRIDRSSDPFFTEFLHKRGLGRFLAYVSPDLFGTRLLLLAQRSSDAGPFLPEEMAAARRLAPHVARAIVVNGQMRIGRSRDAALLSILDKLTYGAMLVGSQGRVLGSNGAARQMLGDGLALQDGRLVEMATNPRGLVDGLMKRASSVDVGKSNSALLHRPSGRKPIVLQVLTFAQVLPWTTANKNATALLILIDLEGLSTASQQNIVQSLGLTLAEARVAAIVGAGFSPVEAAEQLGSAAGTVRTQLKNVFNKLDLKRQSELVRLMTKLEVLGG